MQIYQQKIDLFLILDKKKKEETKIADYFVRPYELKLLDTMIRTEKIKLVGISGELGMGKSVLLSQLEIKIKNRFSGYIRLHRDELAKGRDYSLAAQAHFLHQFSSHLFYKLPLF